MIKNNYYAFYDFKIPKALGKAMLSESEIKPLVENKIHSNIQEKISTLCDLIQYIKIANYHSSSGDCKIKEGDFSWHFNRPAESAIEKNEGNCGANANLFNYILNDNYDEVGFIVYSADFGQGGHVLNYIKDKNKYYIIDFTQYVLDNKEYKILELNKLEEYTEHCKEQHTGDIKIIVTYIAETNIPIANKLKGSEYVMRFFPIGKNINVLYETVEEEKTVCFINPPKSEPNWGE
ncbi:MAG: hypothetical protein N4A63_05200 [Vallitalea sp.]|nr:hypothetical protein [Vallitalea sp.]